MVRAGSARSSSVTKWRATKDPSLTLRMTKELRGGIAIHASKMQCIDPQKLTLFAYPPSSASLTLRHLPHPRGKAYAAVRSFCVTSSASRHLPHQGEGICRRDGHCPSAKMRCVRLFMTAGQFMRCKRNSCHLIRLAHASAPSPSRGRLMP